jgi:hypothetical protein
MMVVTEDEMETEKLQLSQSEGLCSPPPSRVWAPLMSFRAYATNTRELPIEQLTHPLLPLHQRNAAAHNPP